MVVRRGLLALWLAVALAGCNEEPDPERFLAPSIPTETEDLAPIDGRTGPVALAANGAKSETVRLEGDGVVVAQARVDGSGPFRAEAHVPFGVVILFDENAPFRREAPLGAVGSETIRIEVATEARWSLKLRRVLPRPDDVRLPARFSGNRGRIIQVRVPPGSLRALEVAHDGPGLFAAWLLRYEEHSSGILLAELEGRKKRSFSVTEPLAGSYLLFVQATGPWTIHLRDA